MEVQDRSGMSDGGQINLRGGVRLLRQNCGPGFYFLVAGMVDTEYPGRDVYLDDQRGKNTRRIRHDYSLSQV